MKKFFLWMLMVLLLVAAIVGGTGYYFYDQVSEENVEQPVPTVMGQAVPCTGGDFEVPVLGGVFFKHVAWAADHAEVSLQSAAAEVPVTAPENAAQTRLTITQYNQTIFDGTLEEYADFHFSANGSYAFKVVATFAQAAQDERPRAYGTLTYEFTVKVSVTMTAISSTAIAKQGDIVAVRVTNNLDDTIPNGTFGESTPLHFIKVDGNYTAYLALPCNQETGDYTLTVTVGTNVFTLPLEVQYVPYTKVNFAAQEELPDASDDESAAAVEEYRAAVWPLYDEISAEQLWEGRFTVPVTGTVKYSYGMGSLLPGQSISTRHVGIDYAVSGIAAVTAPGAGRVAFAGTLKLTGNTIIIEHGGGIKTYLYHLTDLAVQTGESVAKGQTIGTLGGVGGNVLHYEVRIGNKSADPKALTEAGSALNW